MEYKASKKDNVFKDRRFGEDDPSLSLEEKMLMRFQKERQKRARKSAAGRFNLENDDEDDDDKYGGLMLTHRGRAIGEDDYKDQDLASSDDEDGQYGLGKEIVKVSSCACMPQWAGSITPSHALLSSPPFTYLHHTTGASFWWRSWRKEEVFVWRGRRWRTRSQEDKGRNDGRDYC